MSQLSPEEEKEILSAPPKGTWTLILVVTVGMVVGWIALFGLFLSHGPVN